MHCKIVVSNKITNIICITVFTPHRCRTSSTSTQLSWLRHTRFPWQREKSKGCKNVTNGGWWCSIKQSDINQHHPCFSVTVSYFSTTALIPVAPQETVMCVKMFCCEHLNEQQNEWPQGQNSNCCRLKGISAGHGQSEALLDRPDPLSLSNGEVYEGYCAARCAKLFFPALPSHPHAIGSNFAPLL